MTQEEGGQGATTEITAARGEGAAESERGWQEGGQEMCREKMPLNLVTELAGDILTAPVSQDWPA